MGEKYGYARYPLSFRERYSQKKNQRKHGKTKEKVRKSKKLVT